MKTNRASRFSRINQPVKCKECGKLTTKTAGGGTDLCATCYYVAGLENEHQDGMHDDAPDGECPMCPKVGK